MALMKNIQNFYQHHKKQEDEKGEPEAPAYKFWHLIDYDLKNRVRNKIEKLTKQCQSVMPGIDPQFDVDQLMADCDLEFQSDCEAMMTELDWATNNYAAGAEEIALDEWLSEELFEEGSEADDREMEMAKRLRLREATTEELKRYTPKQLQKCLEMRMCHTRKRPAPEQMKDSIMGLLK